ncbi:hypothetical protein SLA2020_131840 [Shorea laevis]
MDALYLNSEVAYANVNDGTQIVNYSTKEDLKSHFYHLLPCEKWYLRLSVGSPLSFFHNPRKLSIMVEIALSHSSALADNFTVTLKSGLLWPH